MSEVLITLGIIGVVAALTMPAVLNKTNKKELQTAFQSAYSILNQAVLYVKEEDGGALNNTYVHYDEESKTFIYQDILQNKMYSQLKVAGTCKYKNSIKNYNKTSSAYVDWGTTKPDKLLANGMCFSTRINGGMINLSIDINGTKNPNTLGHDIFYFGIDAKDNLIPRKMSKLYTEEELENIPENPDSSVPDAGKQQSGYPCSIKSKQKGNGLGCAYYALINQNPDDSSKTYWDSLP